MRRESGYFYENNIYYLISFVYSEETICGDGERNLFYEECDSVAFCSNCKCEYGYSYDKEKNVCNPQCDINGCLSGCDASQSCSKCNINEGYYEDCHGCQNGYFQQGFMKCIKVTDELKATVRSCKKVIEARDLTYIRKLDFISGTSKILNLKKSEAVLSVENCFDRLESKTPYSYGFWFEINTKEEGYISIETTRHYFNYVIDYYILQGKEIGEDTRITILNNCRDDLEPNTSEDCEFENDDIDWYILDSHVITHVVPGIPKYVFISMAFADIFTKDPIVLFTFQKNACGSFYEEVLWNDIINGSSIKLLKRSNMFPSTNKCINTLQYGSWFLIRGVEQSISISTCDTENGVNAGFNVIEVDSGLINSTLSCSEDNPTAKCVATGSKSCGNGDTYHSKAIVSLKPGKNYFIFLTTNTCMCHYGYFPMLLNGTIKCSLKTCGNGIVDDGEECDGGIGCDHCICKEGYSPYYTPRKSCLSMMCGNKILNDGEECDGGDGCYECECQSGWYKTGDTSCRSLEIGLFLKIETSSGVVLYILVWLCLLIIIMFKYKKLTLEIKEEWRAQTDLPFLESTIIPFNKTNSQKIDIRTNTHYFEFDNPLINFKDIDNRMEVDEPVQTTVELKNNYKEALYFTFHCGEYPKYDIMFSPVIGTVRPGDSIIITVNLIVKCTTILKERVPVTLRYGKLKSILKEIEKNNPEVLQINSSQNSDISDELRNKSDTTSSYSTDKGHTITKSSSGISNGSGQSKSKKNKEDRLKGIHKFHVYLNLQVESALSTKLDYEEINLFHPPIGSGTFGIVYRAEWRKVDVAVKVLKTDLVDLNDLLPNFMQEAEMMERIRCQYVINFIGSVVSSDTLCLVTEFCPLGSLRKYMKTNPMSEFLKTRFCQDIARGMEYLHENDIVHRDLKTDNILVYSNNPHDAVTIKVTDFGTSRSFIESSGNIALQNIGTPMYMAPEIFQLEQMTLKSDVFSFAICMLEIWLGKEPYDSVKFPDSESILKFVCSGKRLPISDDCLVKTIIEQCWAPKPNERPTFKEAGNLLLPIIVNLTNTNTKKSSTKTGGSSHSNEQNIDIHKRKSFSLLNSSEVSSEYVSINLSKKEKDISINEQEIEK
ncbi:serine-threonine protein kinase, putative [Entamoeba dispar SAW760]|uniref:Serine-threonine protein kinase, putative n=1 Tax=Entamoeba dispar (strain ATCC PRA-260 / SAW760) TaxID=370354 RepID=B0E7X5_ENTDS|nr:serine-threonine protein kinase, putative [Entamoeba dispar SAW760]EDR29365.1 serine-threonine protein kinase, putative [Entamoeba dispar SAW760]|eukprot:EDR29365.1 serine-threonine protein kinase, putative [Entamoeba dispar SAW760]